jgi:PAS domain S-box-containing protein
MWGLPGALSCSVVAVAMIEHLIFKPQQINLAPTPTGWIARVTLFIGGSLLVAFLTQKIARQRVQVAVGDLQEQLSLAEALRQAAEEREKAAELTLENQVRSELLLDGANVGIFEWDLRTGMSKWSRGFYQLHDAHEDIPASYLLWRDKVHPEDIVKVEAEINTAIASQSSFHEEYRVVLRDGSVRWVSCRGIVQLDDAGDPTTLYGYAGDVTRRKLADLALLRNEKLAVVGRQSAVMAHEINNPLDTAMNMVYLLRSESINESVDTQLEEIAKQLDRVATITRQTLRLSRTSTEYEDCELAELIRGALDLFEDKFKLANIECEVELSSDAKIECVPGELQQILANLFNNAIDAMPDRGRLRIRLSSGKDWRNEDHRVIRLSISDSGIGIPNEILTRIYEPFFTTKNGLGTGLGMWIVRELVDKLGGTLQVRSKTGQSSGTTVSIVLPVRGAKKL